MQREWHTDFFQKLSSTATPPKGRTVPNMDEILDCEMKGLTLEEDKLRVLCSFVGLIRHIFPALPSFTSGDLNKAYRKITTSTLASKALGPRRLTHLEACALKSASQSRSAKKSDLTLARKDILYGVKTRKWKWQEIIPREINAHITDNHFGYPFANNQGHQRGEKPELGQAARGMDTDIEDVGTSSTEGSSFLDGRPCKGAAYNGDSSKDEDYFSGNGMKKGKAS